jgi:heme exporter protein A
VIAAQELVVADLACERGGRQVLAGVTFSVRSGGALVVTGPNGAGKSSLLRVIAGLLRASAGMVELRSGSSDLVLGEQCHFLGHLDPVKPSLTVAENLAFWARFLGSEPGHDIKGALAAVGLAEVAALPASYLSAGQRRRLSLARLLAVRRPVWLLDEPASTLDAAGQASFTRLAAEHLADGGILVAATHAPLSLDGAPELRLAPLASVQDAAA